MPAYTYRAVHVSGRIAQGQWTAANEQDLHNHLSENGLELLEARQKNERPALWRKNLSSRHLGLFATQMADLLKAGIPFVEALTDVRDATESGNGRETLDLIIKHVRHGSRIAESFRQRGAFFPPVFLALLAAGERSGDLPATFARLAHHTNNEAAMREKLHRALRYPMFLLIVALGVVVFMMTMVVPQVLQFLDSMNAHLPLFTRILVALSALISKIWWVLGLALISFVLLAYLLHRRSASMARMMDGMLLTLPFVGDTLRKLALTRFTQSLAALVQGGLHLPEALRCAKESLGNQFLGHVLENAAQSLTEGRRFSDAMDKIYPPFALRILRIGERSGNLVKSLNDIATTCEREAAVATEKLIGGMEPVLTLLIGGMLAWVVLAVLGPIYGSLARLH